MVVDVLYGDVVYCSKVVQPEFEMGSLEEDQLVEPIGVLVRIAQQSFRSLDGLKQRLQVFGPGKVGTRRLQHGRILARTKAQRVQEVN